MKYVSHWNAMLQEYIFSNFLFHCVIEIHICIKNLQKKKKKEFICFIFKNRILTSKLFLTSLYLSMSVYHPAYILICVKQNINKML